MHKGGPYKVDTEYDGIFDIKMIFKGELGNVDLPGDIGGVEVPKLNRDGF